MKDMLFYKCVFKLRETVNLNLTHSAKVVYFCVLFYSHVGHSNVKFIASYVLIKYSREKLAATGDLLLQG